MGLEFNKYVETLYTENQRNDLKIIRSYSSGCSEQSFYTGFKRLRTGWK